MPEQMHKVEKAVKEEKALKEEKVLKDEKPVTVSVRLAPVGTSDQPVSANHTTVSVAPGIAYLDFGFIEPGALAVLGRAARDNKTMPKGVEGKLVVRVAIGLDVLQRLQNQLQQVLLALRGAKSGPK
jgi:hypothetical protein